MSQREEPVERRLAAILAADVVGYSRLVRADEEGTIDALRRLRAELIDPSFTNAIRMEILKLSNIDQNTNESMMRNKNVRSLSRHRDFRLTAIIRKVSPTSFTTGTVMLAKKTSKASGHMPEWMSAFTPLRMVSGSPLPNETSVMTGKRLAGM